MVPVFFKCETIIISMDILFSGQVHNVTSIQRVELSSHKFYHSQVNNTNMVFLIYSFYLGISSPFTVLGRAE